VQQQLRPLNVPQESIAETVSFMRAFDQTRNVGDDERAKVAQIDNAEMRLQRRKWIVRNLRVRSGDGRDESGFSGIRKTNQTDISKQLQLKLKLKFLAGASFLVITRRAIR
jgi:hypothetical protein